MNKDKLKIVKNIPKNIYLQIGEEFEMDDVEDFNNIQNNFEITWCRDKINDNDIEYIHKDELLSEEEIDNVVRDIQYEHFSDKGMTWGKLAVLISKALAGKVSK